MIPAAARRSLWIFVAAWLPIALITRTAPTDDSEFSRLGTVESLVERHSYWLEESKFHGTADKIFYQGHFYSHQPPVLSTLQAPVFWVLSKGGLHFWNTAPFDLAYWLFTVFTSGASLAAIVVIVDLIFRKLGVSSPLSLAAAFLLPLGSWLLPYGLVTNNHEAAALLVALLALLLVDLEHGRINAVHCALLGLMLGLLIAVEVVPLVSFVPVTIASLVRRRDFRSPRLIASWIAGFALPLALHTVINIRQTGDLLPGGFHTELFAYDGSKFDAATLSGNMNHASASAFLDYAWRALFTEKGFFVYSPVLLIGCLFGLLGWRSWARARGVQLVMLGGTLLSLLASLLMTNNFGGFAAGFRHATYLAPAMLVLLAPWFANQRAFARVTSSLVLLVSVGSAVALFVVTVPRPWFPYRVPPEPPVIQTWDRYFPAIAYAERRFSGVVDQFGKPIPIPPPAQVQ